MQRSPPPAQPHSGMRVARIAESNVWQPGSGQCVGPRMGHRVWVRGRARCINDDQTRSPATATAAPGARRSGALIRSRGRAIIGHRQHAGAAFRLWCAGSAAAAGGESSRGDRQCACREIHTRPIERGHFAAAQPQRCQPPRDVQRVGSCGVEQLGSLLCDQSRSRRSRCRKAPDQIRRIAHHRPGA